jgi:hypothetical protein
MNGINSHTTLAVWEFFKANPNREFLAAEVASALGIESKRVHSAVSAISRADRRLNYSKELGHGYKFRYTVPVQHIPVPEPKPRPAGEEQAEKLVRAILGALESQNELLAKLAALMS